jgi:hypothetical protein
VFSQFIKIADEQPRQQIANLQAKLKNLHMQMQIGSPTAPTDLSSVSLILKWAGTAKSIPAYEYFEGSERSLKLVHRVTRTKLIYLF